MASIATPFRSTYRYLVRLPTLRPLCRLTTQTQQRQAHESPVLFYSVVMGAIGPVLAFGVPPIREHLGYRPLEPIPTTYPRASFSPSPISFLPFATGLGSIFFDVYFFFPF